MIERRANPRQIVPCTGTDVAEAAIDLFGLLVLAAILLAPAFGVGYVVGLFILTGAPTP